MHVRARPMRGGVRGVGSTDSRAARSRNARPARDAMRAPPVRMRLGNATAMRSDDEPASDEERREEALGQQRCDAVVVNRRVGARGDRVVTAHGAPGHGGEDGQAWASEILAAANVGGVDGVRKARAPTSIPPDQGALDSHDYTRLTV